LEEGAVVAGLLRRQLKVTLKLAVLLAAAMNAPASALSSNPNSTPTSSGASAKVRSWLIRAWAAGRTRAIACSSDADRHQ
jgi:hypothetical protein